MQFQIYIFVNFLFCSRPQKSWWTRPSWSKAGGDRVKCKMFCFLCGFSVAWFRSLWSYTVCDCFFSFRNLRGRKRNLSPIILWEERSCRMTGYLTNFVRCDSFPFIQWFWARTEEKVSRLIRTHQLIHLNYYSYIARLKNISVLITLGGGLNDPKLPKTKKS